MASAAGTATLTVGPLLRDWRQRRRLSQLDVSARAAISTRHLSFLETGRARPSREMVLHLADELDVPLRERNTLLVAAGYAPVYQETPLEGDDMATVRETLQQLLSSQEPNPALVVDRQWNLVLANRAVARRNVVLQAMLENHAIDQATWQSARTSTVVLEDSLRAGEPHGQYFKEQVRLELVEVFAHPPADARRLGGLRPTEGHVLVRRHVGGQVQAAVPDQHRRPDHRVERDVVLADEVVGGGLRVLPNHVDVLGEPGDAYHSPVPRAEALVADADTVATIKEMTRGGVEFSFEAIGLKATAQQCIEVLRPLGTATIIGMIPEGQTVEIGGWDLLAEKTVKGTDMGSVITRVDLPLYCDLYRQGKLNLDDMISRRGRLEDVNEAFRAMQAGEVTRTVLMFE